MFLIRLIQFLAAVALLASPFEPYRRASPLRTSETYQTREPEGTHSYSFGPSLHAGSYYGLCLLLAPAYHRRPFRHKARSPQVRTRSFTAQPPDLRRLSLDHESFAVIGLLALLGTASYPVLVHRLTASLHASSPRSVTLTQLRFTSFAVVNSREDFHLQDRAHAGRTKKAARGSPLVCRSLSTA